MRTVIDFRLRPNIPEYMSQFDHGVMDKFLSKLARQLPAAKPLGDVVEEVRRAGISKFVFTGRDTRSSGGWHIDNERIADAVSRYPDVIVGFAGIDPASPDPVRDVDHAVEDLRLQGISLDFHRAGLGLDDRNRLFPIYAAAQERKIPVALTFGPYPASRVVMDLGSPQRLDAVATEFPDLKIVCSHAGWPFVTEMIAVAFRHDNVFVENSIYQDFPGMEPWVQAYNTILSSKILFASGFPFRDYREALRWFDELPLSDRSRHRILYENAAGLLGFTEK